MELNNNFLRIATGNPKIIEKIIEDFNNMYDTSFSINSIQDLDGVTFVFVDTNTSSIEDVYLLGFFHGMEIQELRQKGEIDW